MLALVIMKLLPRAENDSSSRITKGLVKRMEASLAFRIARKWVPGFLLGSFSALAYRIVQKCAVKSLESNTSFYESLLKDKVITDKKPVKTLKKLFDFGYHTKHVDTIFQRVFYD